MECDAEVSDCLSIRPPRCVPVENSRNEKKPSVADSNSPKANPHTHDLSCFVYPYTYIYIFIHMARIVGSMGV